MLHHMGKYMFTNAPHYVDTCLYVIFEKTNHLPVSFSN